MNEIPRLCVLYLYALGVVFRNCFVTTLRYYWGATILLHINLKKFPSEGKLLVSIVCDYYDMQKSNLQNRQEYLSVLGQSVTQFRGVKHDFNNILQTYSG